MTEPRAETPVPGARTRQAPEPTEFFIGGNDPVPASMSGLVRNAVVFAAVLILVSAGLVAAVMKPAPAGKHAESVTIEGVLYSEYQPMLYVARQLSQGEEAGVVFLLSGPGKEAIPAAARGMDEQLVRVRGNLTWRGSVAVLEVADAGAITSLGEPADWQEMPDPDYMGDTGLHGEIVSAKCWSGWMKPNSGKAHRACTKRCLAAGGPAVIVVSDTEGNDTAAFLAPNGISGVGSFYTYHSGRPIYVEGTLFRAGDVPVFVPNQDSFRVLYYESLFLNN